MQLPYLNVHSQVVLRFALRGDKPRSRTPSVTANIKCLFEIYPLHDEVFFGLWYAYLHPWLTGRVNQPGHVMIYCIVPIFLHLPLLLFTKYIYSTLKLFEMAESSSLIVQMDVDEAAIDEGLYSRQL